MNVMFYGLVVNSLFGTKMFNFVGFQTRNSPSSTLSKEECCVDLWSHFPMMSVLMSMFDNRA